IDLPVLEETAQQVDIGLSRAAVRERRDVDGTDALQTHRLNMPQVHERDEPPWKAETGRGLGVRNGHGEVVTQTSQVIERGANGQVRRGLDSVVKADPSEQRCGLRPGVIMDARY